MIDYQILSDAVVEGDTDEAVRLTHEALAAGKPAREVLDLGLIPGISRVGDMFSQGEVFLPELLVSGEAMSEAIAVLEPELSRADVPPTGKLLIGTVQGDVHDIGKNIVIMMMKSNRWQVDDLGVDVSPQTFCSAVAGGHYDILGISALLTMTTPVAEETIRELKQAGLRDKVKIMVGGAPMTREWADQIGADGYASDASEAVKVAASLTPQ